MQEPANIIHVISYTVAPDGGISPSGSDEASEHGYGGGFSSSIVTQQSCNLIVKNLQ